LNALRAPDSAENRVPANAAVMPSGAFSFVGFAVK